MVRNLVINLRYIVYREFSCRVLEEVLDLANFSCGPYFVVLMSNFKDLNIGRL